jgi:tetratricopeptide (TPR) repeat protein
MYTLSWADLQPDENNLWYAYDESPTVLVFVHGILSDSKGCWLHHSRTTGAHVFWPDLVLSDARLHKPSIYLGGYYTEVDALDFGVAECADQLFRALNRVDERGTPGPLSKPNLVFLCHSTGGIVARYMIDRYEDQLRDKTLGLILVASPSYGSRLADRLGWLAALYGQRLGKQLQWGDEGLKDLDKRFKDLVHHRRIPGLFGAEAYENHFIVHRRWLPNRRFVVTEESAGRYFGAPHLLRGTDHFSTVKPDGLRHPAHEHLVDFWQRNQSALNRPVVSRPIPDGSKADAVGTSEMRVVPARRPLGPRIDPDGPYVQRFVGREMFLDIFDDALNGLRLRGAGGRGSSRSEAVRLLWFYGFGGMGKSWFVRNAAARALSSGVDVAMIDWDDVEWREPLSGPPTLPEHVFQAFAARLAQVYGPNGFAPYWDAQGKVTAAAEQHSALQFEFSSALDILGKHGDVWRSADEVVRLEASGDTRVARGVFVLHELLQVAGLLKTPDTAARFRQLRELRTDHSRISGLFENWVARLLGSSASTPLARPVQYLADSLRECMADCGNLRPLLLVLDTCELLSIELDFWLRYVTTPLLTNTEGVLVLIGSRLRPDSEIVPGAKDGWRTAVPQARMRVEAFNENVALTVLDTEQLLQHTFPDRSLTQDLAERLHEITQGVPLALRVVLEMMEDDPEILSTLTMGEEDLVGPADAVTQRLIETVSGRFLLHVEDRPERAQDFDDIIAVGVLISPSLDILRRYWGADEAGARIRRLANRYAVLAGGDLHYTIRSYVRKAWRVRPPRNLPRIAAELLSVLGPTMSDSVGDDLEHLILERANLLTWKEADSPWRELARAGLSLLARSYGTWDLRELVQELPADSSSAREIKKQLLDALDIGFSRVARGEAAQVLARMAAGSLSPDDRALAEMLAGLGAVPEKPELALSHFEAMADLAGTAVPNPGTVSELYLAAALMAMPTDRRRTRLRRAYEWYTRAGSPEGVRPLILAVCLRELSHLEEAEKLFLTAIEADRADDGAAHQLAHLYESQGRLDEAGTMFRIAAERDEFASSNWSCWATFSERGGDLLGAVDALRRAVAHEPDASELQVRLWRLLVATGANATEVSRVYESAQRAIASSQDPDELNRFAWQLLLARASIDDAVMLARKAYDQRQNDLNIAHTLATAYLVRRDWAGARPLVARIIEREQPQAPYLGSDSLDQLLIDSATVGGPEIIGILAGAEWAHYRAALLGICEGITGGGEERTDAQSDDIPRLIARLRSAGLVEVA